LFADVAGAPILDSSETMAVLLQKE
jgi:hypothetical protein